MALPDSREQAVINKTVEGVEALFAPTIGSLRKLAHDGVLLEGDTNTKADLASENVQIALRSIIEAAVMNGMMAQRELEHQRSLDRN